jgi:hypothetical protein
MDINSIRFKNFKVLFERFKDEVRRDDPGAPEKGMMKAFGEKLGVREAYMSHINTQYKNIGPKTARLMEEALKLPHGWMDQQHENRREPEPVAPAPAHADGEQSASLANPTDADELEFLETVVDFYRRDPLAAQSAIMRAMRNKLHR